MSISLGWDRLYGSSVGPIFCWDSVQLLMAQASVTFSPLSMILAYPLVNTGSGRVRGLRKMTIRVLKSLALNVGVRYERLGQFADNLGRNASFDCR